MAFGKGIKAQFVQEGNQLAMLVTVNSLKAHRQMAGLRYTALAALLLIGAGAHPQVIVTHMEFMLTLIRLVNMRYKFQGDQGFTQSTDLYYLDHVTMPPTSTKILQPTPIDLSLRERPKVIEENSFQSRQHQTTKPIGLSCKSKANKLIYKVSK